MLEELAPTGVIGHIHLGTNILVPKPYTGWQREPMAEERGLKEKIALLKRGVAGIPNTSLGSMSIRQAVWQTYISRGGANVADALERMASGTRLSAVLRQFGPRVDAEVYRYLEGDLRWHFMTTPAALAAAEPVPALITP